MLMILEFVQKNLPDRHRRENVRKGPIFGRSRQTVSRVPIRGWLFMFICPAALATTLAGFLATSYFPPFLKNVIPVPQLQLQ